MSDLENVGVSPSKAESTTSSGTATQVTPTPVDATPTPRDPKVIAAYVCFGVGAFIIVVAVVMIIIFLTVRRRRARTKKEQERTFGLADYKFLRTGNQFPISTISDGDRVTQPEVPDYNFTGNGYHFPLWASSSEDSTLPQRHPLDDEGSTLPFTLSTRNLPSTESSYYHSRSSGVGSLPESHMEETDGYVRLHRSSPLAGINAIYNSSGELSPSRSRETENGTGESRKHSSDVGIRGSLKRISTSKRKWHPGKDNRIVTSSINEGFVADDDYFTPKFMMRNSSIRRSAEGRMQNDQSSRPRSSRHSSVLLDNMTGSDEIYHVSLRHDGSTVTQTRVVRHPT